MTLTVTHFDTCLSCYVNDWRGIVVGITPRNQTPEQAARDIAEELNASSVGDAVWEAGFTSADVRREALEETKLCDWRYITDDAEPATDNDGETAQLWFRIELSE